MLKIASDNWPGRYQSVPSFKHVAPGVQNEQVKHMNIISRLYQRTDHCKKIISVLWWNISAASPSCQLGSQKQIFTWYLSESVSTFWSGFIRPLCVSLVLKWLGQDDGSHPCWNNAAPCASIKDSRYRSVPTAARVKSTWLAAVFPSLMECLFFLQPRTKRTDD